MRPGRAIQGCGGSRSAAAAGSLSRIGGGDGGHGGAGGPDGTPGQPFGPGAPEQPQAAAPGQPLTVGARGLAALYAGTPVATLRRAGLAAGGDEASDAVLDGAFAARPFMLDHF